MRFLDAIEGRTLIQKYGDKLIEVSISELIPSEPSVVSSLYNLFMNRLAKGEDIEPIEVAIIDGEYIIIDGNNRAKALKDFGHTTLQATLIKLSPSRRSFFDKTKSLYRNLKGLEKLPIDISYEKRQERYSIKFSHHSKRAIETIVPEENSILISIAGMEDEFADIDDRNWKDVLRLRFSDIQRDFGKYLAFKDYQAHEILSFIDKNSPVNHVYINCEMGVSRSAGLRIGLEKIYNNKDIYLLKFNSHVVDMILKVKEEVL